MRRTGPKPLKAVIGGLSRAERARVQTRAQKLIAEEMSLHELREAIGKTQKAVARRLKVGQDAVSKLESREDMYLSTLRGFVIAMGGELELIARFPGRPPVRLNHLGASTLRRKRRAA